MEQPTLMEIQAAEGLRSRRWRQRASVAVVAGIWFYIVIVAAAWIVLRAADLWWPATLLMFSPRWLLAIPPSVLVPAAVVLGRWRSLGCLLLTLALAAGPVTGFVIPWRSLQPGIPRGLQVRVLTCNMHYGRRDSPPLDRLIASTRPDVVALQEWRNASQSETLFKSDWQVHRTRGLLLARTVE